MSLNVLVFSLAPDAEPQKHKNVMGSARCKVVTVLVKNLAETIEECQRYIKSEGINAVILCPGYTHADVAEVVKVVGNTVSVSVARGDGPSNKISAAILEKAFQS